MPSVPSLNCCNFLGCKEKRALGTNSCQLHGATRTDNYKENQKLYNSQAWKRKRVAMLSKHPICASCLLMNKVTQSIHIDHVIPHKRMQERFMVNVFQGLCIPCHTQKTRLEQKGIYRYFSDKGVIDYNDTDYSTIVKEKYNDEFLVAT